MSSGQKISAVIPTYNCEEKLKTCLKSIAWVDEKIIVDMGSSDGTITLAKRFGAKVYIKNPKNGNFDQNRKYGMLKAKGSWILKIDSDEELSGELTKEILDILSKNESVNGYRLKNKVYMFGKQVRHGFVKSNSNELRLIKQRKWKYNPFKFHQQIFVEGGTPILKSYYCHYNYLTVNEFIQKTNKYTSLDAKSSKDLNQNFYSIFLAPIRSFTKLFFFQKGFLDGFLGLEVSYLFSLYNLIEKVKLWEINKNESSIN